MLRGRLSWARTTPPIREWSGDAPVRIYKRLALATRLASAPDDGVEERRPRLGRSIRKPLIRLTSAQLFEALGPEDHAAMPGPAHPHRAMTSRGTSRRLQVSASDGAEAVTSSVASCITASATASRARKLPGWMLAQPTIAGTRFRGSAVRIQAGRWSSRLVRKSAASGLRLATLPLKRPRPFPRRTCAQGTEVPAGGCRHALVGRRQQLGRGVPYGRLPQTGKKFSQGHGRLCSVAGGPTADRSIPAHVGVASIASYPDWVVDAYAFPLQLALEHFVRGSDG
jgi:hypothetical protein